MPRGKNTTRKTNYGNLATTYQQGVESRGSGEDTSALAGAPPQHWPALLAPTPRSIGLPPQTNPLRRKWRLLLPLPSNLVPVAAPTTTLGRPLQPGPHRPPSPHHPPRLPSTQMFPFHLLARFFSRRGSAYVRSTVR